MTAKGKLFFDFYIERGVIPRVIEYDIDTEGKVDGESAEVIEAKEGLIRQIDAGVLMDLDTAKELRDWLTNKLDQAREGND